MSRTWTVGMPLGPARLHLDAAATPVARLVLGHGAGGGLEAGDLMTLARALPERGLDVVRFEQPWRVAGKRIGPAPARLDQAWLAALGAGGADLPLVVGGRSAGARVACRTATRLGAIGVLALSFPLHPPGRPASSRAEELLGAGVPVLVVQGGRDPFGTVDEVGAVVAGRRDITLFPVPGAGHDLRVRPASGADAAMAMMAGAVGDWVLGLLE